MKTIVKSLSALALVAALAGCGNKAVDAVESWGSEACDCKDEACAKKMKDKFDELEHKYKKEIKDWSEDDEKKADKAYRKGRDCLKKFNVSAG
jgi:hypothetical protein